MQLRVLDLCKKLIILSLKKYFLNVSLGCSFHFKEISEDLILIIQGMVVSHSLIVDLFSNLILKLIRINFYVILM